jgi:peptide/nickel transport system permease protein
VSPQYLAKRLGYAALTVLVVSAVVFGITQVLPGNAAVMILGQFATPDSVSALSHQLGLDRPAYVQYLAWLGGIVSGHWGVSMQMERPVRPVVADALGHSLILAGATLLVVIVVAIPLGVAAAVWRRSVFGLTLPVLAYVGISLPEFVTGTLAVVVVARPQAGWLPATGFVPFSEGLWPAVRHLILPVATLALILTAHIVRQTRSEMIDVLESDYVRTAMLKGLPMRAVIFKHALRNALLPTITVLALDIGYLIGGILVVEQIFAFPGLGRLLVFAVQNRDLPLIQAGALVMAATYAAANLLADVLCAWANPRVGYA